MNRILYFLYFFMQQFALEISLFFANGWVRKVNSYIYVQTYGKTFPTMPLLRESRALICGRSVVSGHFMMTN